MIEKAKMQNTLLKMLGDAGEEDGSGSRAVAQEAAVASGGA